MSYVDGFLLPLPKKNVAGYAAMSKKASKVWIDHGALEYLECAGDDLDVKMGLPFSKAASSKGTETVIFAFIVYKSRAHRDRVNAKVMKDPRLVEMMKKPMLFDMARMYYGGFKTIVESRARAGAKAQKRK